MKKLFLATGIFLSLGLVASAQVKKATTVAASTTAPQQKKTIKTIKQQREAQKNAIENAKAARRKGAVKTGSTAPREAMDTKVN